MRNGSQAGNESPISCSLLFSAKVCDTNPLSFTLNTRCGWLKSVSANALRVPLGGWTSQYHGQNSLPPQLRELNGGKQRNEQQLEQ